MKLDLDLIRSAKGGSRESFTLLYEQTAPALYRTALYTLGNSHDAEDVVSETFVEAYRGLGGLREEAAFLPWMYQILSARCKRKIKEYIRGRNNFDVDQFLELPGEDSDFASASFLHIDLVRAMETLSPQERQIVCLSVFDGYTAKEIAMITSSPQGTISSKLFRALKKLRKLLDGGREN